MPTTTYRYAVRDSLRKLRIKLGLRKPLPTPEPAAPSHQVYHDVGFADAIGAHSYGRDAAISAELARALVGKNS